MRIRLGKEDREMIGTYCRVQNIPKATMKRRVSARFTYRARDQMGDVDCFFKSTLDSLVACGALVDDSPVWCCLGPWEFDRGERRQTVLILEDIDS